MTRMNCRSFICCTSGCDFDNITMCCVTSGDCLCYRHSCCIATGIDDRGVGMTTKPEHGECCKIALYCCDMALVKPQVLCATSHQLLCCYTVRSLPFTKEHLTEPVCAGYCLQCLPNCGCCADPGELKALDHFHKNGNMEIYPNMPAPKAESAMERK